MPSAPLTFGDIAGVNFAISNTSTGQHITAPVIATSLTFGETNHAAFSVTVVPALNAPLVAGETNQAVFNVTIQPSVGVGLSTGDTSAIAFFIVAGNHIPAPLIFGDTSAFAIAIVVGNSVPSALKPSQTTGTAFVIQIGNIGSLTATCAFGAASVGTFYSHFVLVAGGLSPYTWALTGGSLPTGLSLNTSTGLISGLPTAGGAFPYQVTVTDSASAHVVINCQITVGSGGGNPCATAVPAPSTDVQFQLLRITASMKPASRVPVRGG